MENSIDLVISFRSSPIEFVKEMWGLIPQPLKSEYKNSNLDDAQADWFEPFIRGKHITWQQWIILRAVEKAIRGEAPKRISIKSGHGTGKSTVLSWIVIWYLFCFLDAQVPCTAPTSDQIHDVLWKEIALWVGRLPKPIKALFEWTSGYLRITQRPETWFARAKTARKEAPEALAGVHGDYVMYIVDEGSGVAEEIYNTAEGALTGKDIFFIMISNPTRTIGYFYDSHNKDKKQWQTLSFNSEESPIVDREFIDRIATKHGTDSDEYSIRVKGEFPKIDAIDDKGYVPLFLESDIKQISDNLDPERLFITEPIMGIDPSGEGDDETSWVIRDQFKAKIVAKEKISDTKSIAAKTLTLMDYYKVRSDNVFIDNFGIGANVAQELALSQEQIRVNAINVGDKAKHDEYLNLRAEASYSMKQWLRQGGELIRSNDWDELLTLRYRRELSGKMKLMSKDEMRKLGYKSPNNVDALMLTFAKGQRPESKVASQYKPNLHVYR